MPGKANAHGVMFRMEDTERIRTKLRENRKIAVRENKGKNGKTEGKKSNGAN